MAGPGKYGLYITRRLYGAVDASEGAVASRDIIAASASLRPSLKHISQRIRDADDRGANRVFGPVVKMVKGVLKKLFLSTEAMGD